MHWPQDVSESRAVLALMKTPATVLEVQYDYRQVLSLVSRLDVLVGLRYHALVFAAMNGVPLVGLTYDPKNDSFLRLVGRQAAGSTRNVQTSDIVREVAQALENRQVQSLALRGHVDVLRQRALRNAELALELARRRRRGLAGEPEQGGG
jgi:polysaccharide pyruvyl transferase WcaK-like protein